MHDLAIKWNGEADRMTRYESDFQIVEPELAFDIRASALISPLKGESTKRHAA